MIQVLAPILKNEKNLKKFPQCVADDIKRQCHELSTSVYQIRGHIKGKTLLPFPQVKEALLNKCVADVMKFYLLIVTLIFCKLNTTNVQQGAKRVAEEEKRVRESNGEDCNMLLKNTIEGIIIKWAHQIDEVC